MKFQLTQVSVLVSGLFLATGTYAQSTTDVGTINVQGSPGGTGSGQIQEEESPRARSSINRKAIELQNPVNNPYQVINLLPGVSQFSQDGTGLFGGSLRIRGFNSDQLGFTINGAPVNDSGSFTVFPQEYTDSDNLCEVFVTQGATDSSAPHVGATGGNVGLVSCKPTDTAQVRVSQTSGEKALSKTFLRFNTGKLLDDRFRGYFAISHAETEKFKGLGDAYRDHFEIQSDFQLGGGSFLSAGILYNRAVNNNIRPLSKAQIDQQGYYTDYGTVAPIHVTPVGGTAQIDNAAGTYNVVNGIFSSGGSANPSGSATSPQGYYNFQLNPFKNAVVTTQAHFQLAPTLSIDVSPYYWYGYGTGGNELQTMSEVAGSTRLAGGGRDYNGDGDRLDTIAVYEGAVTKTRRPGVLSAVNYDIAGNHLVAGFWFERAQHQQSAPYVQIDNSGHAEDIFLENHTQYLLNADGSAAQFRDQFTTTRARSFSLSDNVGLFNDKLTLNPGVRYTTVGREFTNSPNQGSTALGFGNTGYGGAAYSVEKNYSAVLPNVGVKYQLTDQQSVFINGAKNFKVPPNFAYANLAVSNVPGATPFSVVPLTYVNGVATNYHIIDPTVNPERATNYDLGYRFAGDRLTASTSLFFVNYKNRIAAFIDPNTGTQGSAANLGRSTTKGIEAEAGFKILPSLTAYASVAYTKTRIAQNLAYGGSTLFEPTLGKEFPDTPKWLSGASLQYQDANFIAGIEAKYTGKRYSTLVNDDTIGGYTLYGLNAGFKLDSFWLAKGPQIRMNVYNLFSRRYLSLSGPSGSNFGVRALPAAGLPTYTAQTFYVGAPRLLSVTFLADF